MSLLTRTGADGVLPGWHTIIRGLAPQAGGFRRRSNRGAIVIVADRAHCSHRASPMRAASGYRPPAVSYHTPVRVRLSTPNNDPVARNAQYITNRGANVPRMERARRPPEAENRAHIPRAIASREVMLWQGCRLPPSELERKPPRSVWATQLPASRPIRWIVRESREAHRADTAAPRPWGRMCLGQLGDDLRTTPHGRG